MQTLIRLKTVIERTALTRSTIYLMMSKGEFPRPIKISDRCVAWNEATINDWIEAKLNQAEAA